MFSDELLALAREIEAAEPTSTEGLMLHALASSAAALRAEGELGAAAAAERLVRKQLPAIAARRQPKVVDKPKKKEPAPARVPYTGPGLSPEVQKNLELAAIRALERTRGGRWKVA